MNLSLIFSHSSLSLTSWICLLLLASFFLVS